MRTEFALTEHKNWICPNRTWPLNLSHQNRRTEFALTDLIPIQWLCPYSVHSPNCWMALSALQGSSSVMWTRRFWLATLRSACSEIPELAASDMMAINCNKTTRQRLWTRNTSKFLVGCYCQNYFYLVTNAWFSKYNQIHLECKRTFKAIY